MVCICWSAVFTGRVARIDAAGGTEMWAAPVVTLYLDAGEAA
jgi:hypothetical protein